jgi:flagellar protein FliS
MSPIAKNGALNAYQQVSAEGGVMDASPHQLIQMLLDGAVSRIASAKGYMQNGNTAEKCTYISKAMGIVDGLRGSLNLEAGGEIAENLDNLYEYISRRLLEANTTNDESILDEVGSLLNEIRSAWVAIGDQVR